MTAQITQSQQRTRRHIFAKIWQGAAGVVLVITLLVPAAVHAAAGDLLAGGSLVNGSFEDGFVAQPHCRWRSDLYGFDVGAGWNCFTNQGAARYGFYADAWAPVVADGSHSQLIEINTWGLQSGDNDRYAGIYQTVPAIAGATYRFSLRGMIRTTNLEGDPWRYRVQVGYLAGASDDWREVSNWTDAGWDTYYPRTAPGNFSAYQRTITATSDHITLFVRVWKKWGLTNEEINVNLDSISWQKID